MPIKKMIFFIPSRICVLRNNIFLSFNPSVIPPDMKITSAFVHVPLASVNKVVHAYIIDIKSDWNASSLKKGKLPVFETGFRQVTLAAGEKVLVIDVLDKCKKWRTKKYNRGFCIQVLPARAVNPRVTKPYLLAETM